MGGTRRSATALAALLVAGSAHAAPGDHVRLGQAVLTPEVSVDVGFDSNVYLSDGVETAPVAAPGLIVEPRLTLGLDKDAARLDLDVGYRLKKLLDLAPGDAAQVHKLDRFNEVDAGLDLRVFPKGAVGFTVTDVFAVKNQPTEVANGTTGANLVTTSNDATAGFTLRGDALEVDLLGAAGVDVYHVPEAATSAAPTYNNRASFGPTAALRWKVFPKSSVIGRGSVTLYRWRSNLVEAVGPETEGEDYGAYLGKPDSVAWRALFGLDGQLTTKIHAKLTAGFGQAYYDEATVTADPNAALADSAELQAAGEGYARDLLLPTEGLLADAVLSWTPVKGQGVSVGYRKDFEDAVFTNYIAYNYGYLEYAGLFADRVGVAVQGGVRAEALHGEVHRDDLALRAKGDVSYLLSKAARVHVAAQWTRRSNADPRYATTEYTDLQAEAGVTVTW